MKQLLKFKKVKSDYIEEKNKLVEHVKKKQKKIKIGNTVLSNKMNRSQMFVKKVLYKDKTVNDDTLISIAETLNKIEQEI